MVGMNKMELALGSIVCITILECFAIYKNIDGAYFSLVVGAIGTIVGTVLTHEWHTRKKRANK